VKGERVNTFTQRVLLSVALLLLGACFSWAVDIDPGPATIKQECNLVWPQDLSPAAESTLTAFFADLLREHAPGLQVSDPATMVEAFVVKLQDEQDSVLRDHPDSSIRYDVSLSTEVGYREHDVLSFGVRLWLYTGGAHGNTYNRHIVVDLGTGRALGLRDLFREGSDAQLAELIRAELRRTLKLSPEKTLEQAGLREEAILPVENFFVTGQGIGFEYNPYDIAPYVMGSFRPVVPFEKLQPLLNPGFHRLFLHGHEAASRRGTS